MGLILSLVVALVAVAGLSAGAIALGRAGSNAERRRRLLTRGITSEQDTNLRQAERSLSQSCLQLHGLRDAQLRNDATVAIEKAQKLIDAMRSQPEEIRRNNQFFAYYVPTLDIVLKKYSALENSNTLEGDDLLQKTKGHMQDMSHAFDLMYDNMYKDEALDLDVEIEAMKMSLKREGLS